MSDAHEQNAIGNVPETAWDKLSEDLSPRLSAREQKRARLIRECHVIARADAEQESKTFFGIQALR